MLATMPTEETEETATRIITTQIRVKSNLWKRVRSMAGRQLKSANTYVSEALEKQVAADEAALATQ